VGLVVDANFEALRDAARLYVASVSMGLHLVKGGEVNSSFSLMSERGTLRLGLTNWIRNGTAFPGVFPIFISLAEGNFDFAAAKLGMVRNRTVLIDPADVSVRLYHTKLRASISGGGDRGLIGLAVFGVILNVTDPDLVPDSTAGWIIADATVYGKVGADEFIFSFDERGSVVSMEYPYTRQTFVTV